MTRWNRRMLVGTMAVLVPAMLTVTLAGCEAGADAPTLDFHPAANGATVTHGDITVNNAFVLGPDLNGTLPVGGQAGLFLAVVAQNNDQLLQASAPGTASKVQIEGGTINLQPSNQVTLTGPDPQLVLTGLTRELAGGQTVQVVLDFANAGELTLEVPVEPHAYQFATYAPPAPPSPTPQATASATTKAAIKVKPKAKTKSSHAKTASTAKPHSQATAGATPTATP